MVFGVWALDIGEYRVLFNVQVCLLSVSCVVYTLWIRVPGLFGIDLD